MLVAHFVKPISSLLIIFFFRCSVMRSLQITIKLRLKLKGRLAFNISWPIDCLEKKE